MQLEELQERWQSLDRKLDRSHALELELARRVIVQPARRRISRLAIWPAIDVVFSAGVLLFGGTFLRDHWRDSRLLIPACGVMLAALALLIDSILQLDRVVDLDWTGPVAGIQTSLGKIRAATIRQFKWIMLLSPLLWICGLVVGAQWLLQWLSDGRVSVIDKLNTQWVMGNYLFGVVFALAGTLIARALSSRFQGRGWWKSMLDGLAGNSLKTATKDVELWAGMQREG